MQEKKPIEFEVWKEPVKAKTFWGEVGEGAGCMFVCLGLAAFMLAAAYSFRITFFGF